MSVVIWIMGISVAFLGLCVGILLLVVAIEWWRQR